MSRSILRILDANDNRASEALRVIEESARFLRDDASLASSAKQLRHEMTRLRAELDPTGLRLIAARDTAGDVGKQISAPGEMRRPDERAVLFAAFSRLQQALRCLEEYGKVINREVAASYEHVRYLVYDLEKAFALSQALTRLQRVHAARLYALYDPEVAGDGEPAALVGAWARHGADVVQLRAKKLADRAFLDLAMRLAEALRETSALFIVNDRPDLAVLAGADGVHLGQDDMRPVDARRLLEPGMLVGWSTHSVAQAREGAALGADYLGLGPVFSTTTKPHEKVAGVPVLREAARQRLSLPLFALGGITPDNLCQVLRTGVRRIAVCGTLVGNEGLSNLDDLRRQLDAERSPQGRGAHGEKNRQDSKRVTTKGTKNRKK